MDILQEIKEYKLDFVANNKRRLPQNVLIEQEAINWPCISISKSILARKDYAVIAEFKHKSPSMGNINLKASVQGVIPAYVAADVAAISILTDEPFFGGSNEDFKEARKLTLSTPLLRKDFIVDAYQIYESKVIGADVILLIAAILTKEQIEDFIIIAHRLGLEVLLELYSDADFKKIHPDADLIGINNRNLVDFEVNDAHALHLMKQLPSNKILVSESAIGNVAMGKKHLQSGFHALLIGTNFMQNEYPGIAAQHFIDDLKNSSL